MFIIFSLHFWILVHFPSNTTQFHDFHLGMDILFSAQLPPSFSEAVELENAVALCSKHLAQKKSKIVTSKHTLIYTVNVCVQGELSGFFSFFIE